MSRLLLAFTLVTAACAEPPDDVDEVEVSAEDDGKADASSELRVRTGETTLWVRREVERRETADGALFVLRGRTSRNLTDGAGFVFDDPYGDFAIRSARTFEVTWPVSTARSLVDGVNQFVRLGFAPSSGRPDSLTARAVVRPRLADISGSSTLYLTAELTPVVHGGAVVYRVRGKAYAPIAGLEASAGGLALTDVRRLDDTRFEIDLAPDVAFAMVGDPGAELTVAAELAGGGTRTKTARLGLSLKRLGLTAGDAYDKWPRPDCPTATRTCLLGLSDGAVDLGPCGEAIEVLSCTGQIGVFADDVAVQGALADGAARTSTAAFKADAKGLVGAARADEFAFGAQQTVEDRVQNLFGRWYLSPTARAAALTGAVDAGILAAYAYPLELVEPAAPVPGNAGVAHQVAGDALLAALAGYDFVDSEYARPYEQLVRQYRSAHVASIHAFRSEHELQPHSGHPGWDVFVGNWLDVYVEVSIDQATGEAADVYIEID